MRGEANVQDFTFDREIGSEEETEAVTALSTDVQQKHFIKINIRLILIFAVIAVIIFLLYQVVRQLMKNFQFSLGFAPKRSRYRYSRSRRNRRTSLWRRKSRHSARYRRNSHSKNDLSDDIDL